MANPNEDRYLALDSLRGVCALLVASAHIITNGTLHKLEIVHSMFLFVDYFFVLSGFIISSVYLDNISHRYITFTDYVRRRFFRLYPIHIFILILFLSFEILILIFFPERGPFEGAYEMERFLPQLALLHSVNGIGVFGWNYPSWSISAEMIAYCVFFGFAYWGLVGLRAFQAVCLFLIPIGIVAYSVASLADLTFQGGVWRCLFGFAAGTVVWSFFSGAQGGRLQKSIKKRSLLHEMFAVFLVFSLIIYVNIPYITLLAPIVFSYSVFVFACESGYISRLLRMSVFVLLGTLSYSIYMTHSFVYARILNATVLFEDYSGLNLTDPDRPEFPFIGTKLLYGDLALISILFIVVAFSYITYKFVEIPGKKLGRPSSVRRNAPDRT